MARFKNFGSPASSDEPIVFELYEQQFRCRPTLQGRTLIELVSQADESNMAEAAQAILGFFDRVLIDDSRDRFRELTNSDDYIVDMGTLSSIMEWLIEQYAGRPTGESSDSSPGSETTTPQLMDGQFSPVATSAN